MATTARTIDSLGVCLLVNGAWLIDTAIVLALGRLCADMEAEGEDLEQAEEAAAGFHDSEELLVAEGSPLEGEEAALGEVTNRLAAARLAADCDASPAAQRAGGGAPPPRTALKAMAPMTAAKALMRPADTPSSLASPEALSPSMR